MIILLDGKLYFIENAGEYLRRRDELNWSGFGEIARKRTELQQWVTAHPVLPIKFDDLDDIS